MGRIGSRKFVDNDGNHNFAIFECSGIEKIINEIIVTKVHGNCSLLLDEDEDQSNEMSRGTSNQGLFDQ